VSSPVRWLKGTWDMNYKSFLFSLLLFLCSVNTGFGQFSFVSETQISATGSSSDILFKSTSVTDNGILCATTDGLLLLKDLDTTLFQMKYHYSTGSMINENNPSVVGYQDYAYYSTGDSILQILQIINQDSIIELAPIQLSLPIEQIKISGDKLLIVEQIRCGREIIVTVLDLSNPDEPTAIFLQDINMPWGECLHPSYIRDLALYNDTLIVLARHYSDSGGDFARVFVYGLSDSIGGIPVDTISVYSPTVSFTSFAIKDHYAFIPTTYDSLTIYDLSNTNFLQVVNTLHLNHQFIPQFVEIVADKLLIVQYHSLFVYDISYPQEPVFLYAIDGNLYGSIMDVDFYRGDVIITADSDGLWKYEITDGGQVTTVFPNPLALDIDVNGNDAFIAGKYGGVVFLDVSEPYNPVVMQVLNTNARAREVININNYLYVSDDWGKLDIFDLNHSDSIPHKEYDLGYNVYSLLIRDNYAYIAGYRGFSILNLVDPWEPQLIGENSYSSKRILFANDSLVFTDSYYVGNILVFNVSTPEEPYFVCSIPVPSRNNAVGFESYIYTTSEDSQLVVIDATDPLNPISHNIEGLYFNHIIDAVKLEDTLFISDGNLHTLLVEDPINPIPLTSFNTVNTTGRIDIEYPYIYTADKGFMRIYTYDHITSIIGEDNYHINEFNISSCYPNPFNASIKINFTILIQTQAKLTIYDIAGRLIWEKLYTSLSIGEYSVDWDATNSFGKKISSGLYIVQLSTEDHTDSQKIVLLR